MDYQAFLDLPVGTEVILLTELGNRYEKINKTTWRFLGHDGKRGVYRTDGNYSTDEFTAADFMSSLGKVYVLTAVELIAELAKPEEK